MRRPTRDTDAHGYAPSAFAFISHGLELRIDDSALDLCCHRSRPNATPDPRMLALVHAPSDPISAGQLLATLLTGLTARQITLLDIDQITPRHVAHVDVPRAIQPITRAIVATHTVGRLFSIRTGITEERSRRLRLRGSALYSAHLNHVPEPRPQLSRAGHEPSYSRAWGCRSTREVPWPLEVGLFHAR
jgi:hypothetical protein